MAGREEMPPTVRRSPMEAQDTWVKAHAAAVQQYGEGDRAHRTAYTALQYKYEKVGDRWRRKLGGRQDGSSDRRMGGGSSASGGTAERVDARASKQRLYDVAKGLGVEGRSKMTKDELVGEIRRAKRRRAARERRRSR